MCWEIGQVMAGDMRHAQYHVLVLSDDGCHRICYPVEQESFALCWNSKEQVGQPVVDAAS